MLKPKDIKNSKRKSGYDHVNDASGESERSRGDTKWRAEADRKSPAEQALGGAVYKFRGDIRDTSLEAAQDYVDWYNTQKPITIEDIRNPKRKSGFDHVTYDDRSKTKKPYQARVFGARDKNRSGHQWTGPSRFTAEEAAQDYCNHYNGGLAPASAALKQAGHPQAPKTPKSVDPELVAARAVIREAQRKSKKGYVYLIAEEGSLEFVKIGKSFNEAQYRLNGLQTGNPRKLRVLASIKTDDCDVLEKALHAKFIKQNHLLEWFKCNRAILAEFGLDSKGKLKSGTRTGRMSVKV